MSALAPHLLSPFHTLVFLIDRPHRPEKTEVMELELWQRLLDIRHRHLSTLTAPSEETLNRLNM
jgi:hypothetical protein